MKVARGFATQGVRHTNVTENLSVSVGQTFATVPMWKIRHTTMIGWGNGSGGLGLGGLRPGGWGVGVGGVGVRGIGVRVWLNVRTRSGLRWSFQWKEFVRNHNDVKPFREVIKTKTALLTLKCVEQGYPIFFRSTRFNIVKVLQESRANNIIR